MKIHWFLWVTRHRTVFRGHPKEHETKSTGVPKVARKTYRKVKRGRRRNINKQFDLLRQNGSQNGDRRSLFDLQQRLGQARSSQKAQQARKKRSRPAQERQEPILDKFEGGAGAPKSLTQTTQTTGETGLSVVSGGLTNDSGSPRGDLQGGNEQTLTA